MIQPRAGARTRVIASRTSLKVRSWTNTLRAMALWLKQPAKSRETARQVRTLLVERRRELLTAGERLNCWDVLTLAEACLSGVKAALAASRVAPGGGGSQRPAEVALFHGSREGHCPPGQKLTAPFSDDEALRSPFDYLAVGHYHTPSRLDADGGTRLAYAGAPIALDLSEVGAHDGVLLVPSFAIGRTQELVWELDRLLAAGRIPALPLFPRFWQMVTRHLEGILGHWQQGLTTAFLEGLNSLFSATKRKARGYRSTEYQIAMLYFVAGKLEIPYYG